MFKIDKARAKVTPIIKRENETPSLHLTVFDHDGRPFEHVFPANSRESRQIFETDMETILRMYDGGYYVFNDQGLLVEYRTSQYRGFVQSDEAVARLSDALGFRQTKSDTGQFRNGPGGLFDAIRTRRTNGQMFGGESTPFEFDVDELGSEGAFKASLSQKWSVFSPNIEISTNIERLVCTNGMVATSPMMTRQVPIVNQWEDNLRVVQAQLQPVMSNILKDRFREMAKTSSRASVGTLMRAYRALNNRAISSSDSMTHDESLKLNQLLSILDPKEHLGSHYRDQAFKDARVANAIAGHLTQYDVYNILTEATTHYGREENSDQMVTMELNRMMFDEVSSRSAITDSGSLKPSLESDHRRAFFGES